MEAKTKKLLFAGGVVVAAFVAYKVIKGGKKTPAPNPNPNNGGGGGGNPNPNPTGLTPAEITLAQEIANDCYEAMNTCGTYESTITSALGKIKSNAMFDEVVKQYGTRTISSEWYCAFNSDFTGDLSSSLRSELSSGIMEDINNALAANGVTKTL